jgi:hypothetical protein
VKILLACLNPAPYFPERIPRAIQIMKSSLLLSLVLGAYAMSAGAQTNSADAANSADPYARETTAQRDARMKWWREARFGMFIHWGVYSVPAGTYHGTNVSGIGEWIMNKGKIPVAEYREYAKQFNPTNFNADAWVRRRRSAATRSRNWPPPAKRTASNSAFIIRRRRTGTTAAPPPAANGTRPRSAAWTITLTRLPCRR